MGCVLNASVVSEWKKGVDFWIVVAIFYSDIYKFNKLMQMIKHLFVWSTLCL